MRVNLLRFCSMSLTGRFIRHGAFQHALSIISGHTYILTTSPHYRSPQSTSQAGAAHPALAKNCTTTSTAPHPPLPAQPGIGARAYAHRWCSARMTVCSLREDMGDGSST